MLTKLYKKRQNRLEYLRHRHDDDVTLGCEVWGILLTVLLICCCSPDLKSSLSQAWNKKTKQTAHSLEQNMISKYYNHVAQRNQLELDVHCDFYHRYSLVSFYNMILVKSRVHFTADRKTSTVFYIQSCMIYKN